MGTLAFASICIRAYVTLYSTEGVVSNIYFDPEFNVNITNTCTKSRVKKLITPIEDLLDGPTIINSDDARLIDYIRNYFFLKPDHYEVSLEWTFPKTLSFQ